jgi:hypothetical protein
VKAVCTFCGAFLRWAEPFNLPGVVPGVYEECRRGAHKAPLASEPVVDPWLAWRDTSGEG